MGANLKKTFEIICDKLGQPEVCLCLGYFWVQGLLVPNYDDLHYIFLTEKCGMQKFMYDLLNLLTYIGVIFFTVLYNRCLTHFEVGSLIIAHLCIFFIVTALQLVNALRWNLEISWIGGNHTMAPYEGGLASDVVLNSVCFFFGVYAVSALSQLPMQVLLTKIIPDNVEAAMTAFVTGTFVFSYDVGSKLSGSLFC